MDILKGKTILIGKEPVNGRLLIAIQGNGKSAAIGSPNSVPSCVSRCKPAEGVAHAKIEVDQSGNMILTNIKPQNVTYVNGSEIASKRISINNMVELGKDRYRIGLPVVIDVAKKIAATPGPETYNISHLERIWNDYETEIDRIVKQQQDVAKKRMLPIMVGSLSGVASPLLATLVAVNTLYITVPVAAISFGLYFINYHKKDTSYEDRKTATERLTERYVCPNCHRFLGNISYKLLKNQIRSPKDQKMHCTGCGCEFFEK